MPPVPRITRSNAGFDQTRGSNSTLRDDLRSSVQGAVSHMNRNMQTQAPELTRRIQEKFLSAHALADQPLERGTCHDIRSNVSYTDSDAQKMLCVNRDVKWSKQSYDGGKTTFWGVKSVHQASVTAEYVRPTWTNFKLNEDFSDNHISGVAGALYRLQDETVKPIAKCVTAFGGKTAPSLRRALENSVGAELPRILASIDDGALTRDYFCTYRATERPGEAQFRFIAEDGPEHPAGGESHIDGMVTIKQLPRGSWQVSPLQLSRDTPSQIPRQSKGMLEYESNCSDLAYELDKAVHGVLEGFTGSSPSILNRSFLEQISINLPTLSRQLQLSINEPNAVTCRTRFGVTADGGHQGTIGLRNMDQDPEGVYPTELHLRVFPSEHGWDCAVDIFTAGEDMSHMGSDDDEMMTR